MGAAVRRLLWPRACARAPMLGVVASGAAVAAGRRTRQAPPTSLTADLVAGLRRLRAAAAVAVAAAASILDTMVTVTVTVSVVAPM